MSNSSQILLFGAGKSATVLIQYLTKKCAENQWNCTIADIDLVSIETKIGNSSNLLSVSIDVNDETARKSLIDQADVVISLLPPILHRLVAIDCLLLKKHLLTASYIDDSIRSMEKEIEKAGLLFLCEMGLDPGIDHMSAMKIIHEIHEKNGVIHSFKSHCGGLVATENDTNPWHYKISWNPRNIVNAGKAGAKYKENNQIIQKDYSTIFSNCGEVDIKGLCKLAYYPNRDSISYMDVYNLNNAATFIRTTLRYADFCTGWQKIVAAGLTSDDEIIDTEELSYGRFLRDQLSAKKVILDTPLLEQQFDFLGLYSNKSIRQDKKSAATILQIILEEKWKLEHGEKDMVVMLHEIEYTLNNTNHQIKSSLIVKGNNDIETAMAKTVGLPLGIAASLILQNKIAVRGLHIPITKEIYIPVLKELENEGILFEEY